MPPCRGAILLALLVALAVLAWAAAASVAVLGPVTARSQESELLDIGEQYRRAIQSYVASSPGGIRQYPTRLEDLVNDNRFAQPRHHLRKLFRDPVSPHQPWGLIKVGEAIVGVRSQSTAKPFKTAGFSAEQVGFASARRYADWQFNVGLSRP